MSSEINQCGNEKCDEVGHRRCTGCYNAFYCSKECQRIHWKVHKTSCSTKVKSSAGRQDTQIATMKNHSGEGSVAFVGEASTSKDQPTSSSREKTRPEIKKVKRPSQDNGDCIDKTLQTLMHQMMGSSLGLESSVAEEYRRKYPSEIDHIERIQREETVYRSQILSHKMDITTLPDSEFSDPKLILQRWGSCLHDKDHLMEFLNQPGRKIGDIYERRTYPVYLDNRYFQTMRNASIVFDYYEFGNVYVGFGFVDLYQLIYGSYVGAADQDLKLTFYGFDMSRVVTLRSKVIYGAMKHFSESEVSTECILQIWFSSCWDKGAETCFQKIVQTALDNPENFNMDKEDRKLLRKWKNVDVTLRKAKEEFSRGLRNVCFDSIWTMKYEEDRVAFCRYLFTGCIFVEENQVVCGNPTMFTKHEGATKVPEEAFFKAIDLYAISHGGDISVKSSLFETIVHATIGVVSKFRNLVHSGRIQCSFEAKYIDPKDMEFANEINQLRPYGIDWSNIPDYFPKKEFIRFAEACSVEETAHQLHFLNWTQYVFGACHTDWASNRDECLRLYESCKKETEQAKRRFQMSRDQTLFQFFEGEVYVNNLNDLNICLSTLFRAKFEDYFLSDDKGIPLNRLKKPYCEGLVSRFFNQSPMMFRTAFSFNEEIDL